MPGNPHQCGRVDGANFEQRFGKGLNHHYRPVIEHQAVAVPEMPRFRQIEQKRLALRCLNKQPTAMAAIVVESNRIDHFA